MKKIVTILIAGLFLMQIVSAQNPDTTVSRSPQELYNYYHKKKKVLKVSMDTDSGRIKGYIYNITDTTVTISRDFIAYNDSILTNYAHLKTFNYYNINNVSSVRRGSIPISALAGAVTGALIGLASYQKPVPNGWITFDFGPGADALAGGFLGAAAGTLVGVLVHKQKFRIHKDINRFQTFKLKVLRKVNPNQSE
ncbi:MAG: hypothetical protein WKG06_39395 [Segetibacter sp.]